MQKLCYFSDNLEQTTNKMQKKLQDTKMEETLMEYSEIQ